MSEGLGKQLIVWGDFVVRKEPEILGRLNKNIIIMDWNYWERSSSKIQDIFLKVRANGSRGIGAPALIRYKWVHEPAAHSYGISTPMPMHT
jgi:hypothetical protein